MKTFDRGGVHPAEYKELAKDKPIENLQVPALLYVPVSQHIGAPAKMVVNVGDEVAKGQVVAEAGGYVSTNIHAPVSGRVKSVQKMQDILGRMIDHIVIENDGKERWAEGLNEQRDFSNLIKDEVIDIVLQAGVVGLGGATFPTHVKLNPPKEKNIDTLVINGAECEPYLTCDYRLMLEKTTTVIHGINILKKVLGVGRAIVGIEANKKDAYEKMRVAAAEEKGIEVVLLEVKYPQGAEKQLISAVLGREVPSGGLPMDVGVVVQNIATCVAVCEAVIFNKPLIERVVTVSGDGVDCPGNYLVRLGTPIKDLLIASAFKPNAEKIISGGPMMGISFFNTDLPVSKGTSGIVVMQKAPKFTKQNCIRCGRCVDVCPMGLVPTDIAKAVDAGAEAEYKVVHAMDCMECGSCAFICPARIPLVQYIKEAKRIVLKKK